MSRVIDSLRAPVLAVVLACALALASPVASVFPYSYEGRISTVDAGAGDGFGWAMSLDGDRLVVGAHFHDGSGDDGGVAYVFERSRTGWSQRATLTPEDPAARHYFGSAVALDGDRLLVAALGDSGGRRTGAVYVFELGLAGWEQTAKIRSPDRGAVGFGSAIDVHGDTAVVGAPLDDQAGRDAGAVHIFRHGSAGWTHEAKLTGGSMEGAGFGASLDLDDDTLLVGAPDAVGAAGSGQAHAFRYAGGSWLAEAILKPAAAHDAFGTDVALDGDRAVIGAPLTSRDLGGAPAQTGAAFVYERSQGLWSETATLEDPEPTDGDNLGYAVALDGERLVLTGSTILNDDGSQGAAIVYNLRSGAWADSERRLGWDVDDYSGFGSRAALEGSTLMVSSPAADAGPTGGAVHVFDATRGSCGRSWVCS